MQTLLIEKFPLDAISYAFWDDINVTPNILTVEEGLPTVPSVPNSTLDGYSNYHEWGFYGFH
jgi:hypothetical protein